MLKLKNKKAQSTAEYVIVLGIIIAAVMAMQTYIKRGFQGRIKDAVDFKDTGGQNLVTFTTNQYEPYYLSSSFDTRRTSNEAENLSTGGSASRSTNEQSTRSGHQTIGQAQ